jgi:hypothetical protein
MIVFKLALIIVFAFILRLMFVYIEKNIILLGDANNQTFIITIIMWLMIINVAIIIFLVLFNYYQTEWKSIGKMGKRGPDGIKGDQGSIGCNKNLNKEVEQC